MASDAVEAGPKEASAPRAGIGDDARAVAWWVLVGVASGALAGLLVGGVGGRLAMLLLRLTSPDFVIGLASDDGFEIGVVSTETFSLLFSMAALGGVNGVLYAALRGSLPRRLRLPLWSLFSATLGGATIVHEDGLDFTLLEPALLAIVLFVVLPGAAAALVVVLVERWVDRDAFSGRAQTLGLVVAALVGTVAVAFAVVVAVVATVLRRAGAAVLLARFARIGVPLGLVAISVTSLIDLVQTSARIV